LGSRQHEALTIRPGNFTIGIETNGLESLFGLLIEGEGELQDRIGVYFLWSGELVGGPAISLGVKGGMIGTDDGCGASVVVLVLIVLELGIINLEDGAVGVELKFEFLTDDHAEGQEECG